MTPLSIFSGPWGWLIKWGIIAALVAVWSGYFYVKGIDHQQNADAVEHTKQQEAAQAAALRIAGLHRTIVTKLLGDLNDLKSHQPHIAAVTGGVCNTTGSVPSGVSGLRSGTLTGYAPSEIAGLGEAIAFDAGNYPECVARLHALVEAVKAAGGDKP